MYVRLVLKMCLFTAFIFLRIIFHKSFNTIILIIVSQLGYLKTFIIKCNGQIELCRWYIVFKYIHLNTHTSLHASYNITKKLYRYIVTIKWNSVEDGKKLFLKFRCDFDHLNYILKFFPNNGAIWQVYHVMQIRSYVLVWFCCVSSWLESRVSVID